MPALTGSIMAFLLGVLLTSCGDDTAKPAPAALTGPAVALQDDYLALREQDPVPRMDLLADTGVKVTRFDIIWRRAVGASPPANPADPADPAYDFAHFDAVVKGLKQRGITPIVSVYSAPDWATGGKEDGDPVKEWNSLVPDSAAYGAFMEAVSRRYSGRFAGPDGTELPQVRHWEVWNEPNLRAFLSPQLNKSGDVVSVTAYARLVRAAYRAIKRGGGDGTVVLVGASGPKSRTEDRGVGAAQWLAELRRLNVPLDAYSMHIYPAAAPNVETDVKPSWSTVDDFLAALEVWRPGLDLYITEAGYTTLSTAARPKGFVTEEEQARYLRDIFNHPLVQNPRVRAIVWFNLQDNLGWTAGLLRGDLTKKPSFEVFQEVAKQREQRTLDN